MERIDMMEQQNPTMEKPVHAEGHDKADYKRRLLELSPEDQAFMDGYLFAKVTEAARKGA